MASRMGARPRQVAQRSRLRAAIRPVRHQGDLHRHTACRTRGRTPVPPRNLHLSSSQPTLSPTRHEKCGLSSGLVVPPNITLVPLPPKCPELNPQENVWQFLRDNWLSNRVFKSYNDILDHCCYAWNKLIDQPWRIMSIGMREWPYRF